MGIAEEDEESTKSRRFQYPAENRPDKRIRISTESSSRRSYPEFATPLDGHLDLRSKHQGHIDELVDLPGTASFYALRRR